MFVYLQKLLHCLIIYSYKTIHRFHRAHEICDQSGLAILRIQWLHGMNLNMDRRNGRELPPAGMGVGTGNGEKKNGGLATTSIHFFFKYTQYRNLH